MLEVNTMNFCPFGACRASQDPSSGSSDNIADLPDATEILIAVPNTLASEAVSIPQVKISSQSEYA
jgi:hypothetical protein